MCPEKVSLSTELTDMDRVCPADSQAEDCSTGVVTDMSESMAGAENEGPASANCATSKLAGLSTTKEAEGIRTECFRPKLSAVPEDDIPAIKRGVLCCAV